MHLSPCQPQHCDVKRLRRTCIYPCNLSTIYMVWEWKLLFDNTEKENNSSANAHDPKAIWTPDFLICQQQANQF